EHVLLSRLGPCALRPIRFVIGARKNRSLGRRLPRSASIVLPLRITAPGPAGPCCVSARSPAPPEQCGPAHGRPAETYRWALDRIQSVRKFRSPAGSAPPCHLPQRAACARRRQSISFPASIHVTSGPLHAAALECGPAQPRRARTRRHTVFSLHPPASPSRSEIAQRRRAARELPSPALLLPRACAAVAAGTRCKRRARPGE